MIQYKQCKGTGQAHGFGCDKQIHVSNRKYGLCPSCYAGWLFDSDAGKVKLSKGLNKTKKTSTNKSIKSDIKIALELTRQAVHEYVRLRDKGKPCISCGTPWQNDFQACHFYKAELYETLRFNLDNIHGGCPQCNLYKDGNIEQYALNIPLRIGPERFNNLNQLAQVDKQHSKVWNIENLEQIRTQIKILKTWNH